jgi:hypothetical protein
MNIKRTAFFVLLILLFASGSAFAHDKGDTMLNIDLQLGVTLPEIDLWRGGVKVESPDVTKTVLGGNFAVMGTFYYYFFDFFALNAGAGVGLDAVTVSYADRYNQWSPSLDMTFACIHPTIPVGFRFSFGAFVFGAGATVNIPVFSTAYTQIGTDPRETDKYFKFNTYLGYYVDIGFDLSGIKGRTNGFGMALRFAGSFSDKVGKTTNPDLYGLVYDPFRLYSLSLVFQFANELGKFPIGGK